MKKIYLSVIRSSNFSARLIQFGMWLYAVLRFKKPIKIYNHMEVRYGKGGEISSGAISEGVKTRPWPEVLHHYRFRPEVKTYEIKLTNKEYRQVIDYLTKAENTKYEYSMFITHMLKIIFGVWLGGKSSKHLFCYEHGINALNATGKYNLSPYMNPYEFLKWADKNLPLEQTSEKVEKVEDEKPVDKKPIQRKVPTTKTLLNRALKELNLEKYDDYEDIYLQLKILRRKDKEFLFNKDNDPQKYVNNFVYNYYMKHH